MTAAHFLFIPAVLIVGIVIGWILGSRAAHDALGAELRRREERQRRRDADIASSKLQDPSSNSLPNSNCQNNSQLSSNSTTPN